MGLFIYFPVKSVKSSFFASITFQRKFLEQAIAFVEKWALGLRVDLSGEAVAEVVRCGSPYAVAGRWCDGCHGSYGLLWWSA